MFNPDRSTRGYLFVLLNLLVEWDIHKEINIIPSKDLDKYLKVWTTKLQNDKNI